MTDLTVTTWIVIALLATTIAGIGVAAYLAHVAHTARADAAAYLAAAHATLASMDTPKERAVRRVLHRARVSIARARRSAR